LGRQGELEANASIPCPVDLIEKDRPVLMAAISVVRINISATVGSPPALFEAR